MLGRRRKQAGDPSGPSGAPAPQLQREIGQAPRWMYEWELGDGTRTPAVQPTEDLMAIHRTRLAMMESEVRSVIEAAGDGARVLDLACNEGWFAHRMLDWGAEQVVGVDIRELNIRRATLIRDHYGIDPKRLELRQADVFDLDPAELGEFDVVLLLGLIYHLEDPMGAIRIARACCSGICAIEAQLSRQSESVEWGAGPLTFDSPESFAVNVEDDAETNPVASTKGILSLIPNRAAMVTMAEVAGFAEVSFCEPGADAQEQFLAGDRGQILAKP